MHSRTPLLDDSDLPAPGGCGVVECRLFIFPDRGPNGERKILRLQMGSTPRASGFSRETSGLRSSAEADTGSPGRGSR